MVDRDDFSDLRPGDLVFKEITSWSRRPDGKILSRARVDAIWKNGVIKVGDHTFRRDGLLRGNRDTGRLLRATEEVASRYARQRLELGMRRRLLELGRTHQRVSHLDDDALSRLSEALETAHTILKGEE